MHAPLSWKVERVGGYPVSTTQMLPVSVAAGSRTLWARVRHLTVKLDMRDLGAAFTAQHPQHLGCLVSGPKHRIHTCTLRQTLRETLFLCCHTELQVWMTFYNWQLDRICNMGKALSLVFIYVYNICTDFFFFLLTMKEKLTSGMPGNLEVICLLVWFWYFGV